AVGGRDWAIVAQALDDKMYVDDVGHTRGLERDKCGKLRNGKRIRKQRCVVMQIAGNACGLRDVRSMCGMLRRISGAIGEVRIGKVHAVCVKY
ncbi:hypothetical protein ACPWML_25030, partial [Pandoraea pneumonica]|uniref:hypothetical protein n=1 Tax=Pandoraea pneumonica TaxID=2508299 RepID=UPI003CF37F54